MAGLPGGGPPHPGRNRLGCPTPGEIGALCTPGELRVVHGQKGRDAGSFFAPMAASGLGTKINVADTGSRRIQVFER